MKHVFKVLIIYVIVIIPVGISISRCKGFGCMIPLALSFIPMMIFGFTSAIEKENFLKKLFVLTLGFFVTILSFIKLIFLEVDFIIMFFLFIFVPAIIGQFILFIKDKFKKIKD